MDAINSQIESPSGMNATDPQLASPLFSVLPAEVRMDIYAYALTPTPADLGLHTAWLAKHNYRVRHDHADDPDDREWETASEHPYLRTIPAGAMPCSFRPDLNGRPVLSMKLLLTCRRVWREARHLLFDNERCSRYGLRHANIRNSGPRYRLFPPWYIEQTDEEVGKWLRERRRWERQFTKMRLVGPVEHLYHGMHTKQQLLRQVEHLRITVRHQDWYIARGGPGDEDGPPPLLINALGPPGNVGYPSGLEHIYMYRVMDQTKGFNITGKTPPTTRPLRLYPEGATCSSPSWMPPDANYFPDSWAREFVNMPRLKTFTMDFDTCERRREELASIVDWAARTWRMPLNPNHSGYHYLSADGNPVRKMSWRGTIHDWESRCHTCSQLTQYEEPGCKGHEQVWAMFKKGFGPRMYSWTVTWTPRVYDGPEVYPYDGSQTLLVSPDDIQHDSNDSGLGSGAEEDQDDNDEDEPDDSEPGSDLETRRVRP